MFYRKTKEIDKDQKGIYLGKLYRKKYLVLLKIDGKTMETVRNFILGGSKITADSDCSHEIKRHLFLGRKTMTNLDSIFKSRDITLPSNPNLYPRSPRGPGFS